MIALILDIAFDLGRRIPVGLDREVLDGRPEVEAGQLVDRVAEVDAGPQRIRRVGRDVGIFIIGLAVVQIVTARDAVEGPVGSVKPKLTLV